MHPTCSWSVHFLSQFWILWALSSFREFENREPPRQRYQAIAEEGGGRLCDYLRCHVGRRRRFRAQPAHSTDTVEAPPVVAPKPTDKTQTTELVEDRTKAMYTLRQREE